MDLDSTARYFGEKMFFVEKTQIFCNKGSMCLIPGLHNGGPLKLDMHYKIKEAKELDYFEKNLRAFKSRDFLC